MAQKYTSVQYEASNKQQFTLLSSIQSSPPPQATPTLTIIQASPMNSLGGWAAGRLGGWVESQ